jgi:hypothetical protein
VKTNVLYKLHHIRNFNILPLTNFKDLIIEEEYKTYEKFKIAGATWSKLILNVFISFLYMVIFLHC